MRRVVSVGQCHMDHGSIQRFLNRHFEVTVVPVATAEAALRELRQSPAALVLVNRQFDADGTEGLDFIQTLKADTALSPVPVMLVTNFPEYAQQAVSLGAVPGFGKAELNSPELPRRLEPYLTEPARGPA